MEGTILLIKSLNILDYDSYNKSDNIVKFTYGSQHHMEGN